MRIRSLILTPLTCICLLSSGNVALASQSTTARHQSEVVSSSEYASGRTQSRSQFGQTREISVGSPVPNGWVVLRTIKFGAKQVIFNTNGASYSWTVEIVNGSPVPAGWATTEIFAFGTKRRIFCTIGARAGTTIEIVRGTNIPAGWVYEENIPFDKTKIRKS